MNKLFLIIITIFILASCQSKSNSLAKPKIQLEKDTFLVGLVRIGDSVTGQCYTYQAYICYYPSNSSSCWQTRTSCFTSQLNGRSDGFIPANSQTGVNSTSWLGVPTVEALGVNHLEEYDAGNTVMQTKFAEIFNNPSTYFFTNRR